MPFHLGGSSPDLVSRKNLGRVASKDASLHKTMDNLHSFMEQQQMHFEEDGKLQEQVGGFSKQVILSMM